MRPRHTLARQSWMNVQVDLEHVRSKQKPARTGIWPISRLRVMASWYKSRQRGHRQNQTTASEATSARKPSRNVVEGSRSPVREPTFRILNPNLNWPVRRSNCNQRILLTLDRMPKHQFLQNTTGLVATSHHPRRTLFSAPLRRLIDLRNRNVRLAYRQLTSLPERPPGPMSLLRRVWMDQRTR